MLFYMAISMTKGWTLRSIRPYPDFPSVTYFWVDGNNIVRFQREITPLGFIPVQCENIVGRNFREIKGTRLVKSKATQEQLKQGWMIL